MAIAKVGSEFLVTAGTWDVPGQEAIAAAANRAALLSDGRYVTVRAAGPSPSDIDAQFLDADGDPIGAAFRINTTTQNFQEGPSVSALAGGRFVVAWTDYSPSGPIYYDPNGSITFVSDVRAQILNADGSKVGSEFLVNTNLAGSQYNHGTETLADGRFVAMWSDPAGLVAQVFTATGARSGGQFTVTTKAYAGSDITALPDGRFVVAWSDESRTLGDEHLSGIHAQIFNANGTKSGAEFLVNTSTIGEQKFPAITTLADGRFAIAWEGAEHGDPVILQYRVLQGTIQLDYAAHADDNPETGIFAQLFNADGSKAGGEINVNNKIYGAQYAARLAELDDGRLAVVWNDKKYRDFSVEQSSTYAQILDLNALASNDILYGTPGPDALAGSIGDDIYVIDNAGDVITEYRGEGLDRVSTSITYALPTGAELEKLSAADNAGTAPISLTGNEIANAIYGNQGDNTFDGKDGSDSLTGFGGNDRIEGGTDDDKAFYFGARAEYDVRTLLVGGELQTLVAHQGGTRIDGTDTLTNVELLRFSDHTFTFTGAQLNHGSSIDGDRFDDVLFQNASTGQVLYAHMVGGVFQDWRVDTAPLGGDLKAIATGDVNPSATGGAETFVQRQSDGAIYYASHDTGTTTWGLVSAGLDEDWKLRAVANIDDGRANSLFVNGNDLTPEAIIQNQVTGQILYAEILDGQFRGWISPNDHLNSDWVVVGAGNILRSTFDNIMIQNQTTGTTYAGFIGYDSGISWAAITSSITPEWHVKGIADLTGDGRDEVIFQQASTGTTYYTDQSEDFRNPHWGVVTANVTPDWVVQGTADVDNDGFADVLFQNRTNGTTYYANMGPAGFEGWGAVASNISSEWQAV